MEPSQLEALYRFRHDIYVDELGWLPAHKSGLLRDGFDDLAYNYAAIDADGAVIGSMRVVPDTSAGLPLERVAQLNGYRSGKRLVELCRLVVHPDHRGSRLGGLLMKAGYQRAVMYRASHILLDTYVGHQEACQLYQKMGFEEITGQYLDSEWCCDLPVMTLSLDLTRALREWPTIRKGLYRFFTDNDAQIVHD